MGLSQDRLALVERYMIDAEEAEARAQAAAEIFEARAQHAEERVRPAGSPHRDVARVRRDAPRARDETGELLLRAAREVASEERARPTARRQPRGETLSQAQRRAVEQPERIIAAMEKREARERKALAKAAAKRRARERRQLAKASRHSVTRSRSGFRFSRLNGYSRLADFFWIRLPWARRL